MPSLTPSQQEDADWYFRWATQSRRDAFNVQYNAVQWSPLYSPAEKRSRIAALVKATHADYAPAYALMDETERQLAETGEISDELSEKWSQAKAQIEAAMLPVAEAAE